MQSQLINLSACIKKHMCQERQDNIFALDEMAKGNEAIRVAMDLALQGNCLDVGQDFSNALKCYETSIEKLIPIVEGQETLLLHHNGCYSNRRKRCH